MDRSSAPHGSCPHQASDDQAGEHDAPAASSGQGCWYPPHAYAACGPSMTHPVWAQPCAYAPAAYALAPQHEGAGAAMQCYYAVPTLLPGHHPPYWAPPPLGFAPAHPHHHPHAAAYYSHSHHPHAAAYSHAAYARAPYAHPLPGVSQPPVSSHPHAAVAQQHRSHHAAGRRIGWGPRGSRRAAPRDQWVGGAAEVEESAEGNVQPDSGAREASSSSSGGESGSSSGAGGSSGTSTSGGRDPHDVGGAAAEAHWWGSLTAGILHIIVSKIGDSGVKHMRLVCRHWRGVVDHNLEALTPTELHTRSLVRLFPNLRTLHLTNCADVRNRDLLIISASGLSLHTLTLGDDANKPWVTNEGLAAIARMPTLTSLNLHDCSGVTNSGLRALTKLQALSSLSLRGCRKLTTAAIEAIQGHSALTALNLYGCRVTDQGLLALQGLQLVSLHLGGTRVRDEGLRHLASMTTLQELHFDQEDLSDAGVAQLTVLTRLKSLALRDCADVSADSLSVLIPALPNLMSLDLYKNFTLDDVQLSRCLEFLGAVTFLDLRGTPVTDDGLQQLTKLTLLQKLCLAPTQEYLWSPYLCVVSNLTQLTSLSINNCTLISFGQLETLRQLKLLRELDLSHDSSKDEGVEVSSQQPVNATAIHAMACITSLTSIDLSRRPVHQEHLSTLAERLPRLHSLIIVGCPVLKIEVQSLQRRFPELVIHRKPLFGDVSCSSSDHGIG